MSRSRNEKREQVKKGDGGENMEQLTGCFCSREPCSGGGSETVQLAREGFPYLKSSGMHLLLNRPLELSAANPFPFYKCQQYACFSCGNGP